METTAKEHELDQMLRFEQIKELSSEEEDNPSKHLTNTEEEEFNRSYYKKPIKNSYSDQEADSDSSI